jgi:predicted amidohydrolase
MKLNIAIIQFEITQNDPAENWERIEKFILHSVNEKAEVVVFPEDCITGPVFDSDAKIDSVEIVKRWQELAVKHRIDIVTGSILEEAAEGKFKTSYYIDFKGEVLGSYRKNHLHHPETKVYSPGTEATMFETSFGKAAIVMSRDLLFPEIFQRLKEQGVQIIYCPSYWYREAAAAMAHLNDRSEEDLVDALCLVRAVETNAAIVYCNAAGTMKYEDGKVETLIGHSQIAQPVLGIIQEMRHHHEKMFVHEVDLGNLKAAKKIYQS